MRRERRSPTRHSGRGTGCHALPWLALALVLLAAAGSLIAAGPKFSGTRPLAEVPALALAASAVVIGLACLVLLRLVPQAETAPIATRRRLLVLVAAIGLALRCLMLATEPALEIDYARYLWDGAVTANGYNPYAISPADVGNLLISDPRARLADAMGPLFARISYPDLKTVYPPVAQAAFALAYFIDPFSPTAWRVVCIGAEIGTFLLLLRLLGSVGRSPLWVALYWWNPLVVKELVNSAHMEAVLVPLVLAALLLLIEHRRLPALVVLCLAAGTKVWPVLLLPLFLRPLAQTPRKLLAHLALAAAMLGLLALPMAAGGLDPSSGIVAYAQHWSTNSALFPVLERIVGSLLAAEHAAAAGLVVRVMLAMLLIGVACRLARGPLAESRDIVGRAFLLLSLLVLLSPAQFPWYVLWILPLAVLMPGIGWHLATALLPAYYLSFHLFAYGTFDMNRSFLTLGIWAPIWIALILDWRRLRLYPSAVPLPGQVPTALGRCVAVLAAALSGLGAFERPAAAHDRPGDKNAPVTFIEEKIRSLFPGVAHIGPAQLTRMLSHAAGDVVLVDVRSEAEFAISRIAGADRMDPDSQPAVVFDRIGDIRGKSVVFYCAIGLRSSRLAVRLGKDLAMRGAGGVYNLSGGLFRWHNEERPLVNAGGETRFIHPYRRFWRRYLDKPQLSRELLEPKV